MKSLFKLVNYLGRSNLVRSVGGIMLAAVAAKVAVDGYEAIKKRVAEPPPAGEPPIAPEATEV
jgi:hypothetical protein